MRSKAVAAVAMALAMLVATLASGPVAHAEEPAPRRPIVLVHGWASTTAVWDTFVQRLVAHGYDPDDIFLFGYDTTRSNRLTAFDLDDYVSGVLATTGADKVDMVTHSMGGLNSRWCLKFRGCAPKVANWVSLAGPNNGTERATTCPNMASCQDMTIGSTFLFWLAVRNPVPGPTRYATWWSPCDGTVLPRESTIIPGAANTQTRCLLHHHLLTDAVVFGQVMSFLEQG